MNLPNEITPGPRENVGDERSVRPTRVRWHIVFLLALITALTYVERLNLSIAGKYIQDKFGFSTSTMAGVVSAVFWGYALFLGSGGWAGDPYGPPRRAGICLLLGVDIFGGPRERTPTSPLPNGLCPL